MMDITLAYTRSDNDNCLNATAFCTSDIIDYEAAHNGQQATEIANYGCAYSRPNPSWYFMRIDHSGQFIIHLEGVDPNTGNPRDIDFVMWGPFDDPTTACSHLTADKIIDCSYSTSGTEDAYLGYPLAEHHHLNLADGTINYHVPQSGEYYLFLITNFSNQECAINFHYEEGSGPGTTDCSLLPALTSNDGPYCVGETIHLHAEGSENIEHYWTGPNNFTSRWPNPNIPNCTMNMTGPYICTLTHNGQTASDTTWVVIYPSPVASFTATTACVGSATQFDASSSTTDPPGYNIASYEWNFGDGTTGSGVMTSHTYAQAGTYTVTLHVSDAEGHCSDEVIQTIMVVSPNAEDYYVTICEGESYTFNGVTYSQEGDYSITIQTEGCESTATLHLTVIDLDVQIEVIPNDSICEGDTVTLHANSSYELVAVGDILCTDGIIVKPYHFLSSGKTAKGIVFYVDDSHLHGYAVSLTQLGPMKWSTQYALKIATYSHWRDAIADFNGYDNTQILRTGTTAATYPAAWAVDFDNGWYLPAAGQVNLLYGELVDVNVSLILVGGTPIVDTTGTYGVSNGDVYLWSTTEWNRDQAMTVKVMDGLVRSYDKGTTVNKHYVRSVINF
jgi:PKD repeat protein